MSITCTACGIISPDDAERCDCGRALSAELQKHDDDWGPKKADPRPDGRRQTLFTMFGTLIGALLGGVIAAVVFSPGHSSSSSGISDLPPAIEVPLDFAAGLGSAALTAGAGLCTMVMGVLFGGILGGTTGLALGKRSRRNR